MAIGGNWNKSPKTNICFPPKGFSLLFITFSIRSILSNISARTIDISSITIVSTLFKINLLVLLSRIVSGEISSTCKSSRFEYPKAECKVAPPILMAAIPVGASLTRFFFVNLSNISNRKLLPVPAFPVINIFSDKSFIRWNASICSSSRTPNPVPLGTLSPSPTTSAAVTRVLSSSCSFISCTSTPDDVDPTIVCFGSLVCCISSSAFCIKASRSSSSSSSFNCIESSRIPVKNSNFFFNSLLSSRTFCNAIARLPNFSEKSSLLC